MSKRSFQLFHRPGRSYLAKLTFPDGSSSEIDTKEKDQRKAESRARYVIRQRWAKRRHYRREKLRAAGKPVPLELERQRPGRRKEGKVAELAPAARRTRRAAPPPIDAGATAEKLRELGAEGLGDNDVPPMPEDPGAGAPDSQVGEAGESGAPGAHGTQPTEIPPLPPPPPAGDGIKPDAVIPPTGPSDGEFMSEMIATAICAGTIRGVRWMGEQSEPPWRPAEPHQGSLEWLQKGLAGKLRLWMGDRIVSDGTKAIVGFLGVVASMVIGSEPMHAPRPAPAGAAADDPEVGERHAAPAPAPHHEAPPAPPPQRQIAPRNGAGSALGRF